MGKREEGKIEAKRNGNKRKKKKGKEKKDEEKRKGIWPYCHHDFSSLRSALGF